MRIAAVLSALCAVWVFAEDTTSPLIFTYLTFTHGSVSTATTTYGSATGSGSANTTTTTNTTSKPQSIWSSAPSKALSGSHPTSYVVSPSHLAYPTFRNVSATIANAPLAPGLQNATQFAAEALGLIALLQKANSTNCRKCKNIMSSIAATMKVQQEALSIIANPFCAKLSTFIPTPICIGLLKIASTDIGGIFPAMNMQGQDGQTLCAFMLGTCSLPAPSPLNLTALFKGTKKPAPVSLVPSKKKPLKVLHFSDYHLDLRYVVGSEAICGGSLCCRVFPYTNVSAPINTPASLFGNYQCDTPEALATSVFRAVPKVTGYGWEDFSFGIYTGDLVSHDLWELTEPYVLANELESYQQFFNGMGGVTLYPTLGNHDTYPHAFTAFPAENSVLPANASYPVQQLYNYQNVSSAWANYGWLSAADAQTVVTSGLGIYRTVTKGGLIIISLNSDVWYYFNIYSYIQANAADKTGMFGILIDYLLEAESKEQAVWIIQHVNTGGGTSYEALPAPSDLWYAIVDRFNNTIRGTFFGHTHKDEFGIIYSNNATHKSADTAAAVAYIMPSVTPYQEYNAGFRYYLVDHDTFSVIDSVTYYANVSNTNAWTAAGDVTWEFEYSARQTYDYRNTLAANEPLSPAWWHSVAQDIATNATTFRRYTDLRPKLFRPYANVTGTDRSITLCGLTSMSVPIFETCLGTMNSITSFL